MSLVFSAEPVELRQWIINTDSGPNWRDTTVILRGVEARKA